MKLKEISMEQLDRQLRMDVEEITEEITVQTYEIGRYQIAYVPEFNRAGIVFTDPKIQYPTFWDTVDTAMEIYENLIDGKYD